MIQITPDRMFNCSHVALPTEPWYVSAMPSFSHSFLVEVFREYPELLPQVLQDVLGLSLPAHTEIRVADGDISELPPEFRADLVLHLVFQTRIVLSVIVEVQLSRDERKKRVWPAYTAVERARQGCPCSLVVVTLAPDVAAWAGQTIVDGNPGGVSLRPVLLGPSHFPPLTAEQTEQNPELAMLGLLTRQHDPTLAEVAGAALQGMRELPEERRRLYYEIIFAILREAVKNGYLESVMLDHLTDKYKNVMHALYEEGLADGITKGKANDILMVLRTRGFSLPEEMSRRILACQDIEQLNRWLLRAITLSHLEDLFAP
jgi:hypothetical protein